MGKIISINKRCYPAQDMIYGRIGRILDALTTTTVLVEGRIGDYAAYIGYGDPEWVAKYGDKLSYIEARCQFPGIDEEKYRD